ncbi:MAG: PaaI family thioesterase [Candidatus Acidiferrales bacterium]
MKLTFEQDDATKRIRGAFKLGAEYQGGPGFIHGGIIATVLDEAMGKLCRFRAVRAVTAELNVEYLKPVLVDAPLLIEAYEAEKTGRNLHFVGEIRNQTGDLLARGRGRFVVIEPRESRVKDTADVASDKKIS